MSSCTMCCAMMALASIDVPPLAPLARRQYPFRPPLALRLASRLASSAVLIALVTALNVWGAASRGTSAFLCTVLKYVVFSCSFPS